MAAYDTGSTRLLDYKFLSLSEIDLDPSFCIIATYDRNAKDTLLTTLKIKRRIFEMDSPMPLMGRSLAIFTVSMVMLIFSAIAVTMRIFVRVRIVKAFGWDDTFMICALVRLFSIRYKIL